MSDLRDLFRRTMAQVHRRREHELRRSWCLQDQPERHARLGAVVALSAELTRIEEVSLFATAFGRKAIEEIIMGDWHAARETARVCRFDGDPEDARARYVPLWSHFVDLVEASCAAAEGRARGEAPC